jgi:hypothetical protein
MEREQVNDRAVLAEFGRQCLSRALSISNDDMRIARNSEAEDSEAEDFCAHQARSADAEVDDEIDEVKLNSQLRFLC